MATVSAAETKSRGQFIEDAPIELSAAVTAAERARIDAVDLAMPSATSVFVPGGGGGGSGVVVDPAGFALTNFHVTSPAGTYMQCSMADGKLYDAVIVGIDPVGDLAMIQLLGREDFPAAEIGDSRSAQPGDWSLVIGNPFLLAGDLQPTVTWGMISGVGRYQYPSGTLLEYGDCLQTDASINPGNSGGPIYDARGKLLGIVGRCSFEKRGRVNVGVGYAISIHQAMNFAGSLRVGLIVDHATLGATVVTDPDGGVRVSNILENSDAFRRGLRYDDEILRIDGRSVVTANDVLNVMATLPANWRVPLTYRRGGEIVDTLVRLRSVHTPDELLDKMAGASPPPPPRPDPVPKPDDGSDQNLGDDPEGDDPEGDDPSPNPDGEREPHDGPPLKTPGDDETQIPAAVQQLFAERRGFANHHFNEIAQNEFIAALRSAAVARPSNNVDADSSEQGNVTGEVPGANVADAEIFEAADADEGSNKPGDSGVEDGNGSIESWTIRGETPDGVAVQIRITPERSSMTIGNRDAEVSGGGDRYNAVESAADAAILTALSAWQRMILAGPKQFGETYAAGTAPLGGQRPLRNFINSTDGEMEVHFITHPDDQRLESIEVVANRDQDPAELWIFSDGPTEIPDGLSLRFGTDEKLTLQISQWLINDASDPLKVNTETVQ